jgi:hypothetical protein
MTISRKKQTYLKSPLIDTVYLAKCIEPFTVREEWVNQLSL